MESKSYWLPVEGSRWSNRFLHGHKSQTCINYTFYNQQNDETKKSLFLLGSAFFFGIKGWTNHAEREESAHEARATSFHSTFAQLPCYSASLPVLEHELSPLLGFGCYRTVTHSSSLCHRLRNLHLCIKFRSKCHGSVPWTLNPVKRPENVLLATSASSFSLGLCRSFTM